MNRSGWWVALVVSGGLGAAPGCGETDKDRVDAAVTAADGAARDGRADAESPDAPGCPGGCTSPLRCDPERGRCVTCLTSEHCPDPTRPRCDPETRECGGCQADGDCGRPAASPFEDPNLADARCDVTDGRCVQCTVDTQADDCGANSCDPQTRACSSFARGSRETCEACLSDDDCAVSEDRCVAMNYAGELRPTGYCLRQVDPRAGCVQPFGVPLRQRPTRSGEAPADYCGINENLASCEAVRGLLDNAQCPGGTDAECAGPGAVCRTVGFLGRRCSYPCSGAVQCDMAPNPGSTCGRGPAGDVNYCGG